MHSAHPGEPTHVLEHAHEDDAGHGHGHDGGHGHDVAHDAPVRVLGIAFITTFCFMGVEAGVGWWSGSLALLADAGHMLADAGALGLALWAQHFAGRPRSQRSTFGWRRAEVLAAFVNGVLLAVTALAITLEACERLYHPLPILGSAMLGVAILGLLVNLAIARLLMSGKKDSVNVRAALAHVLTDALGSVGAIAAGLCVMLLGWMRADPIISMAIAALVALSGWRVLKETTAILLEAVPSHLDTPAIFKTIEATPGVTCCADLHVWAISDTVDAVSAHIVLEHGAHGVDVCDRVASRVRHEHSVDLVTVQPLAPAPNSLVPLRRSESGDAIGPQRPRPH